MSKQRDGTTFCATPLGYTRLDAAQPGALGSNTWNCNASRSTASRSPSHSARRIPRSVRWAITRRGSSGEGPACQATTVSTSPVTSASRRRARVSRLKYLWTSADITRRTSGVDGNSEGGRASGAVIAPG